ncbi:hypothetical protein O181_010132 [Austropuccinia psidii MF-1]|uniref:Uncharacterized protein n=1 Tax=Austropuccinia psidii MF-1 TaxID=1389203 RepID=A0A9Q3BT48_9BASI|nr:hypothetical protein [Austropuccinia psidii MF-1]
MGLRFVVVVADWILASARSSIAFERPTLEPPQLRACESLSRPLVAFKSRSATSSASNQNNFIGRLGRLRNVSQVSSLKASHASRTQSRAIGRRPFALGRIPFCLRRLAAIFLCFIVLVKTSLTVARNFGVDRYNLAIASVPESKGLLNLESAGSAASAIDKQTQGLTKASSSTHNQLLPTEEVVDGGTSCQTLPAPISLAAITNYRPYYPQAKAAFNPEDPSQKPSTSFFSHNVLDHQPPHAREPVFVRLITYTQSCPISMLEKPVEPPLQYAWHHDGLLVPDLPPRDWNPTISPHPYPSLQEFKSPSLPIEPRTKNRENQSLTAEGGLLEHNSSNQQTSFKPNNVPSQDSSPPLRETEPNKTPEISPVGPSDTTSHTPRSGKGGKQIEQDAAQSTSQLQKSDDSKHERASFETKDSQKPTFATILKSNKASEPKGKHTPGTKTISTETPIQKAKGQEKVDMGKPAPLPSMTPKKQKAQAASLTDTPSPNQKNPLKHSLGFNPQPSSKTGQKVDLLTPKDLSFFGVRPTRNSFHKNTEENEDTWTEVSHGKKKTRVGSSGKSVSKGTTTSVPFEMTEALFSKSKELELPKIPATKILNDESESGVHENEATLKIAETNETNYKSVIDVIQGTENSQPSISKNFSQERVPNRSNGKKEAKKQRKILSKTSKKPSNQDEGFSIGEDLGKKDAKVLPASKSHDKINQHLPHNSDLESNPKIESPKAAAGINFNEGEKPPVKLSLEGPDKSEDKLISEGSALLLSNLESTQLREAVERVFSPWRYAPPDEKVHGVVEQEYKNIQKDITEEHLPKVKFKNSLQDYIKVSDQREYLLLEPMTKELYKIFRKKWVLDSKEVVATLQAIFRDLEDIPERRRRLDKLLEHILQNNISENWERIKTAFLQEKLLGKTEADELEKYFQLSTPFPDLLEASKSFNLEAVNEAIARLDKKAAICLGSLMSYRESEMRLGTLVFTITQKNLIGKWKPTDFFQSIRQKELNCFEILSFGQAVNLGSKKFSLTSTTPSEILNRFLSIQGVILARQKELVSWYESTERAWILKRFGGQYTTRLKNLCFNYRRHYDGDTEELIIKPEGGSNLDSDRSLIIHKADVLLFLDNGITSRMISKIYMLTEEKSITTKEGLEELLQELNLPLVDEQKITIINWFVSPQATLLRGPRKS